MNAVAKVRGAVFGLALVGCAHPPPGTPVASPRAARGADIIFHAGPAAVVVAELPAGWADKSRLGAGTVEEIRFIRAGVPMGAPRPELRLSPMVVAEDDRLVRDPAAPAEAARRLVDEVARRAADKHPPIEKRELGHARLWIATATIAHPQSGEPSQVTAGIVFLDGLPFGLTILHADAAARDEQLAALARWSGLGSFLVVHQGEPDPARMEARCRGGDGLMCALLVQMTGGDDPMQDLDRLAAGCQAGSPLACTLLGTLYVDGRGVPLDRNKARKVFALACDQHAWLACAYAAQQSRGEEGLGFLERACDVGGDREDVCRTFMQETLPAADYHRTQQQACAGGDKRACWLLGWSFETGYGATPDVAAARAAYAQACARDSLWGCFREALLTPDPIEQARRYDAACRRGSAPACFNLAQPRYGRSPESRRALLRQACESSNEVACIEVLSEVGPPSEPP